MANYMSLNDISQIMITMEVHVEVEEEEVVETEAEVEEGEKARATSVSSSTVSPTDRRTCLERSFKKVERPNKIATTVAGSRK